MNGKNSVLNTEGLSIVNTPTWVQLHIEESLYERLDNPIPLACNSMNGKNSVSPGVSRQAISETYITYILF